MKNPVFVAIDTTDRDRARTVVQLVGPSVGGVKLGLEYFAANGPSGVKEIAELGLPLFLESPLHCWIAVEAGALLRPVMLAVLVVPSAVARVQPGKAIHLHVAHHADRSLPAPERAHPLIAARVAVVPPRPRKREHLARLRDVDHLRRVE